MWNSASERSPVSPVLILSGLALIVALAYANSLPNGFVFDDTVVVVKNPLLKRVELWPTLLTSDYWAGKRDPASAATVQTGLYRPLTLMSFAFNYMGAGLTAWSYHAVNLVLHALVTWLLYLLALQLGFSFLAGLVGAVLFALHPIHTEAVSGIVGRSELLMAAGVLASLRWGIQGRPVLSLTAFLLALLSKEQAVMLPVLLLLFHLLFGTDQRGSHGHDSGGRHVLARYGPYALVLLGYVFLRWWALGTLKGPPAPFLDNPLPHLDVWPRLLTTIKVAGTYLWLCLWPVRLSGDYSFHAIPFSDSLMDGGVLFGLLTWGGMLAFAVLKYRTFPGASFAVGFLMLTFLPVSNLLMPIGTIMGERLFYLPSAGLCLLFGAGYDAFDHWTRTHGSGRPALGRWLHVARAIGLGLLIGVCLLFLLRTILRNQDWVDDDHIAQSTLQAVPNSAKAHSAVGRLAKDKQQWDEAISHFQKALSIYPAYTEIDVTLNSNLGISLIEKGLVAEGTAAIERAVALDPSWSLLWYNLGFAYSKQSLNREAEAAYHQAARLNDEDPMAYTGLGFLFLKEHRYEDALASADAALHRDPSYVEARYVKAKALEALEGNGSKGCTPGLRGC